MSFDGGSSPKNVVFQSWYKQGQPIKTMFTPILDPKLPMIDPTPYGWSQEEGSNALRSTTVPVDTPAG